MKDCLIQLTQEDLVKPSEYSSETYMSFDGEQDVKENENKQETIGSEDSSENSDSKPVHKEEDSSKEDEDKGI